MKRKCPCERREETVNGRPETGEGEEEQKQSNKQASSVYVRVLTIGGLRARDREREEKDKKNEARQETHCCRFFLSVFFSFFPRLNGWLACWKKNHGDEERCAASSSSSWHPLKTLLNLQRDKNTHPPTHPPITHNTQTTHRNIQNTSTTKTTTTTTTSHTKYSPPSLHPNRSIPSLTPCRA